MSEDKNISPNIVFKKNVKDGDPLVLVDYLEKYSKLSKSEIKRVLNNGGVWLRKFKNSKRSRARRATTELNLESYIEFFYDPKLHKLPIPTGKEIYSEKDWGIWYKPPGLLSQGTDFGDHLSLLRQIEKIKKIPEVYLVHRLDREAHGLMIFAYTSKMAAYFSKIFSESQVQKIYEVEVVGNLYLKFKDGAGEINLPLDGKKALTEFTIKSFNGVTSTCQVSLLTGKLHQIRRHFEHIGFPVLGDPKYGVGNKNTDGMKLLARTLAFCHPIRKNIVTFTLDDSIIDEKTYDK